MSKPDAKPELQGAAKVARDVFAGTCGGIVVTLVGHPFDTLKIRLQTQPSGKPIYSGMMDCVRKTIQWEGPTGLYKGVTSPLAGQMFFRATLFGAFGASKRWLSTNADGSTRPLRTSDYYKAGAMTGFVAAFTEGPIDFYKSQVQVQIIRTQSDPNYKPPFTSVSAAVRQTLQVNGFRGPFQGITATVLRNTPANSVYLGSFEVMKNFEAKRRGCTQAELGAATVLGAAGLGGLMYWAMIFPVDVIKSAMQSDPIEPARRQYPTVITAAQKLWAEGGVGRFYKGFTPCIIRAMPANASMLFTVDRVTTMLS